RKCHRDSNFLILSRRLLPVLCPSPSHFLFGFQDERITLFVCNSCCIRFDLKTFFCDITT
ncbi:hypothetical protein NDU88_006783, partial [Pleurodeles waltl]